MDKKEAQVFPKGQRGILNRMRETINSPARALKKVFKPEWGALMEQLTTADNKIRAITTGEDIDGQTAGDNISTKQLLKEARSKFNRREYLIAASLLGRFHHKMDEINRVCSEFKLDFDKLHNKFLFAPLNDSKDKRRDEHLEHLQNLRQRLGENTYPAYFIKEAGFWDTVVNTFTPRGRAGAVWEKQYPQKAKVLRTKMEAALNKADGLQARLLGLLKEMDGARARSELNEYVSKVESIPKISSDFDRTFKELYSTQIKPMIDMYNSQNAPKEEPVKELPKEEVKDLAKQEVKTENKPEFTADLDFPSKKAPRTLNQPPATQFRTPPASVPSGPGFFQAPAYPFAGAPSSARPASDFEKAPTTPAPALAPASPGVQTPTLPSPGAVPPQEHLEIPPPPRMPTNLGPAVDSPPMSSVVSAHQKFYSVLNTMGNEDPLVTAAFIRRYAQSIQAKDPETAIKLFGIAKQLKG